MELRIAQTLERLGRDPEAEAPYRAAIAGKDGDGALVPCGLHLMRRGQPEEALGLLQRFVAVHPDDVDALMFLADGYAGAGRMNDAIQTAQRARAEARARCDARTGELIDRRLSQYGAQ